MVAEKRCFLHQGFLMSSSPGMGAAIAGAEFGLSGTCCGFNRVPVTVRHLGRLREWGGKKQRVGECGGRKRVASDNEKVTPVKRILGAFWANGCGG